MQYIDYSFVTVLEFAQNQFTNKYYITTYVLMCII